MLLWQLVVDVLDRVVRVLCRWLCRLLCLSVVGVWQLLWQLLPVVGVWLPRLLKRL